MDVADLVVARIGKPHGLRGEVTVQLHTDDPQGRFVEGTTFVTQARGGTGVPRTLTLRSARLHNGTWLLTFDEIPDRTGAESLRGTRLLVGAMGAGGARGTADPGYAGDSDAEVTRGDTAETDDADDAEDADGTDGTDEGWYEDELRGLAVVTRDGTPVGEVSALEIGAAQDLLVITLAAGGTAYLPFVAAIVPEVDVPGGRVVVDPPEGLLELNA